MKKKYCLSGMLIAICIMSLTACNFATSSENMTQNGETDSQNASDELNVEENQTEIKEDNKANDENQEFVLPEEQISVSFQSESGKVEAEDGTEVLDYKLTYPIVSMEETPDIADKINKDIENYISTYHTAVDQMSETAIADYEFMKSEEGVDYYSYSMEAEFSLQRKDDAIISFTMIDWNFTGGAHGNYGTTGINYSVSSGDRITLDTISADSQSFKETTGEYLYQLSQTSGYQERLFEEYDKQILIESLYMEGKWYLSNSGIVFFSDPYMLGPYAAGTIEFTVPYEELVGLKEEFKYQGNYERKAAQGNEIKKDLNGDGKEEIVFYDVNYTEDEYLAEVTFQVDGKEVVSTAVLEFPNEEYYLVDLDQDDKYIEIAIQDYGPSEDPVTYFFRYLEDGSTILLGGITDLWSSDTSRLLDNNLLEGRYRLSVLQTWYAPAHWKVEQDQLVMIEEATYYPYESSIVENQLMMDITVYETRSLDAKKIILTSEDGPIRFISTDDKNWVELETKNGSKYQMYLKDYSKAESDGQEVEATSIFDSLIIAD